ncbi:hypothetical protein M0802_015321 [Mischocyttarus mexicanus]|nr:hypothetical protein M0802_015321 [Mischocyttarus mexicanus]
MEAIHQLITRRVDDKAMVSEIMMNFNLKNNDQDRVKYVLQMMHELDVVPKIPLLCKNTDLSEKCRDEGNRLFFTEPTTDHELMKLLDLYSRSIAYAIPSSQQLALGYGNRSATLLRLKQYNECISDINRALSADSSNNFKLKLYIRKIECLLELGESITDDYNIANEILEQIPSKVPEKCKYRIHLQYLYEQSRTKIKKKPKQRPVTINIPKILSPNLEVPCASDAIVINYDDYYGRHIAASRDIKPGELIAVEKAYACMLDPINAYSHCANCLECCLTTIPCDNCYCSMYCSEKCKSEHWKQFHDIECSVFCILFEISESTRTKFHFFAIRLALQAVRESGSIESLKNELQNLKEIDEKRDPKVKGFDSNMKLCSDKYRSIYSLVTNIEKRSSYDVFTRTIDACILLYFLVRCTTFFGKKDEMTLIEMSEFDDAIFIGGLILTHQQIIPSNVHTLEETYDYSPKQRGVAAMAFYSLFNHSCEANVIRYSAGKSIVMRTMYPIRKGEQLFDSYGEHYAITSRPKRRENLLKQFYFLCDCLPCRDNWPTFAELDRAENLVKPPLQKSFIKETLKNLDSYMLYIAKANTKIIEDRQDIIEDIINMIKILYERSLYPCLEMSKAVETIKYAYNLCGNLYHFPDVKLLKD